MTNLDCLRRRWRAARRDLRLLNTEDVESFGTGSPGHLVPDLTVRLIILPADPFASTMEFDSNLWTWWTTNETDPAIGPTSHWGGYSRPTVECALRYQRAASDSTDLMAFYLGLCRHGGLDMAVSSDGAYDTGKRKVFTLTTIVGRVWSALASYARVVDKYTVNGPWEVALGLRKTSGAVLGNFGEGWEEPERHCRPGPICLESHVLIRLEVLDTWPDVEGIRDLAFRIGGRVEDSFGCQQRRFLNYRGALAGEFAHDKCFR